MTGNPKQDFMPFRWLSQAALLCMLCLVLSQGALGASVVLAWDPSIDPAVVGYFLYIGTASESYSMKLDVGNYRGTTVSGLLQGRTYYFVATAYDVSGYESPFSFPEVSAAIPDASPPDATITWPPDGALLKKNLNLTIAATATDNVGVTTVNFYINGKLACSDATTPYTCRWRVPPGRGRTHQFQATAHDAAGNARSSGIVTVTTR
jgi:hypothetical protein